MPKQKPSRHNPPQYLMLGKVLRPHGVRGELRLSILTDYPERVNDLETVYIGKTSTTTVPSRTPSAMLAYTRNTSCSRWMKSRGATPPNATATCS